jgi:TetR/AcrR family transcriptional regulator, cholesterol catabolism regulator
VSPSGSSVSDATAPRRGARKEARYQEIVAAAGALFAEHGFDGTSLLDIAKSVGVLKGSLYHHITSKEDLLYDVIRIGHQGLNANLALLEHFGDDPARQLVAFVYGHVRLNAIPERLVFGAVILRDSDKLGPQRRAEVTATRDAYEGYLRRIVAVGQVSGAFDRRSDARLCTFGIFGIATSYNRWYTPDGPIPAQSIASEFAHLALASVSSEMRAEARWEIVDAVADEFEQLMRLPVESA